MIQPPAAAQLPQIADLWEFMQEEWQKADPWRRDLAPQGGESATVAAESAGADEGKAAYETQLRQWYRDPAAFLLVGVRPMGHEEAGAVVAFIVSRLEQGPPRYGRIIDLYVQPSLRGNNLARHMVEAASGWMRAQGARYLEADVLTSNRPGMAFFASTQFQLYSSVLRKPL